jgi:exosortase family protein XrtM
MHSPKIHILAGKELRFAIVFLLAFCILQYTYMSSRGSLMEHLVIDVATVSPSVELINFIDSSRNAIAQGNRILAPKGSISVLNGCEGTETLFLLSAAIIAFRTSWMKKLKGMLLGVSLIYCLNQARIVALFFSAQESRKWFDILHGYIAPSLIIVMSSLFFLWWANTSKYNESTNAA